MGGRADCRAVVASVVAAAGAEAEVMVVEIPARAASRHRAAPAVAREDRVGVTRCALLMGDDVAEQRFECVQRGASGTANASSTSRSSATMDDGALKRISASEISRSCARICSGACNDEFRHSSGGASEIPSASRDASTHSTSSVRRRTVTDSARAIDAGAVVRSSTGSTATPVPTKGGPRGRHGRSRRFGALPSRPRGAPTLSGPRSRGARARSLRRSVDRRNV